MGIDEFLELVRTRRSVRTFKPDPVPGEYVDKILEAGRWAMSGGNGQPWEFVVIKDARMRAAVFEVYREHRTHMSKLETTRRPELAHPAAFWQWQDAPVIVAVCGDPRTMLASVVGASLYPDSHVFHMNLGNCMQIIHLAAASLGLGSGWISITCVVEEKLKALLGVPGVFRIHAIIPIGYPTVRPRLGRRRALAEMVHLDRYDMSKYRSDDDILAFTKESRAPYRPGVESDKASVRS